MQPCKFTFDDSPVFDGFDHGSTWNGFDNVAVTAAERERIAVWMRESAIDHDAVAQEIHDLMGIDPIDPLSGLYSLGWGYATQIVREPAPLPVDADHLIADHFVTTLRTWLTKAQWHDMRTRNAAETDPRICHSHDFCDSNMAMAHAFETVAGRAPDADSDADSKLWNNAWVIAMPSLRRKV